MSISFNAGVFSLCTDNVSYIFRITKFKHLEHIHFGERMPGADAEHLAVKHDIQLGSSILY